MLKTRTKTSAIACPSTSPIGLDKLSMVVAIIIFKNIESSNSTLTICKHSQVQSPLLPLKKGKYSNARIKCQNASGNDT